MGFFYLKGNMRDYKREEIIFKLSKKGIKLVGGVLTIPKDLAVGIKTWGMIDFLKVSWQRKNR